MKKYYKKFLLIIPLLAALLSPASVRADPLPPTAHPYWAQNSDVQYNKYVITAKVNPLTLAITVNPVSPGDYIKNVTIASGPYPGGGYYSTFHIPGESWLPLYMPYTQVNDVYNENGRCFWGETLNELGSTIWPPEPKISCNPVVGEKFFTYSSVDGGPATFKTLYKTQAVDVTLGQFTNVVMTTLIEYSGNTPKNAYSYGFSRDSGTLVYIAHGPIGAGGNINGFMFWQNPWP